MKTFIISLILFQFLFTGPLFAHETELVHEEPGETVTFEHLGVQEPRLLPGNPLYFFKEFVRGLRRAFTFDEVAKAELELKIASEKAAEAKKVAEQDPDDAKGIERALLNYERSQERLQARLESLRESSGNPNVDRLLDEVAQRQVVHVRLLEELEAKHETQKSIIQNIMARVHEVLDEVEIEEAEDDAVEEETDVLPDDDTDEVVLCTLEYAPVCGADGKTYGNRCSAEKQYKVKVAYEGQCRTPSTPIVIVDPCEAFGNCPAPCVIGDPSPAFTQECRAKGGELVPKHIEGPPCMEGWECKVSAPSVQEITLEADDSGFYPSSEVRVKKGARVKLIFRVRTDRVYYGGLDFRSSKFTTQQILPGGSVTVEFTADESFEFKSYWPATGVLKATGRVIVE